MGEVRNEGNRTDKGIFMIRVYCAVPGQPPRISALAILHRYEKACRGVLSESNDHRRGNEAVGHYAATKFVVHTGVHGSHTGTDTASKQASKQRGRASERKTVSAGWRVGADGRIQWHKHMLRFVDQGECVH